MISTKEWFWTLVVLIIPFVNLVLLVYWGFSQSTNLNKRHYSRAALIVIAIEILLVIVYFIAILLGLTATSTTGLQ